MCQLDRLPRACWQSTVWEGASRSREHGNQWLREKEQLWGSQSPVGLDRTSDEEKVNEFSLILECLAHLPMVLSFFFSSFSNLHPVNQLFNIKETANQFPVPLSISCPLTSFYWSNNQHSLNPSPFLSYLAEKILCLEHKCFMSLYQTGYNLEKNYTTKKGILKIML